MELLVGIFIGIAVTLLFSQIRFKKPSGTFIIDLSDPMKDICNLELSETLDSISMRKRIRLNVKVIEKETR